MEKEKHLFALWLRAAVSFAFVALPILGVSAWNTTYVIDSNGNKICADCGSYNVQDGAWSSTYTQYQYSTDEKCLTYTILMDEVDVDNGLDFYIDLQDQYLYGFTSGYYDIYASSATGANVSNYLWKSSSSTGANAVASESKGTYFHIDYDETIAFYSLVVWVNATNPWVSVRAGYNYYLIPSSATDLTSGCIKMSPARLRDGGVYSTMNWMVHLQDFYINELISENSAWGSDKTMSFRIYSAEEGAVIGPSSATTLTSSVTTGSSLNTAWGNIYGLKNVDGMSTSYTNALSINTATLTDVESVTLLLNTYGTSSIATHQLEAVFNKTNMGLGAVSDTVTYYLLGNFGDADADVDIDPSSDDDKLKMTPYWYKDGAYSLTSISDYDSLVYKATVTRPSAGWGEMYMVIAGASQLSTYTSTADESWWDDIIRPQEQFNVMYNSRHISGLDATATHGGLQTGGSNTYWDYFYNTEQAFNPLMNDDVEAYVFSMNVTTSTYNIQFIDADDVIYIAGPAVATEDKVGTGWESSSDTYNAVQLTYDTGGQYYYYAGDDGSEAAITMTAQEDFVFSTNLNYTQATFAEDGVTPVDLHVALTSSVTNDTEAYEENDYALASDDTGNGDTQYVNFLVSTSSSSSTFYGSQISPFTFNLPTGDYTIRLYPSKKIGSTQLSYYVIKDRSYRFYQPSTKNSLGTSSSNKYTTFRSFSDYHAVVIPSDIDVLYVTTVTQGGDDEDSYVTMKQFVDFDRTSGGLNVLPANTPVILATTSDDTDYLQWKSMAYYCDTINYEDDDLIKDNILIAQTSAKKIPQSETTTSGTMYNYLFGYKTLNGTTTIGFFPPADDETTNCAVNTAYLQAAFSTLSSGSSDAKGLLITFEGDEQSSETTAISAVEQNTEADGGAYYTLQGVRVSTPTAKGVYIHNGKKFIVK